MRTGALIKYYRTKKGMTQRELAQGVCSISHLSKIENNSKEAHDGTIDLLLNKLGITLQQAEDKQEQFGSMIEDFITKLIYYQKEQAEAAFQTLSKAEELITFTPYINYYSLWKYRYLIFVGDINGAAAQREHLGKIKKNFSQHETYLYSYFNALSLIQTGQLEKADNILSTLIEDKVKESAIGAGDLFYHYGLVKSMKEESGAAVHYGKKALGHFSDQFNFKRILHTLMLLGINYTHAGIYHEAAECFRHLLRNIEALKIETALLPQIYHNMGYLYRRTNDLKKASLFYKKSLHLHPVESSNYLISLYSYAETLHKLGDNDSRKHFEKLKLLAQKASSRKYELMSHYHLTSFANESKALEFLQERLLPFLEKTDEHENELEEFYQVLARHLIHHGKYEKAIQYITKYREELQ
ncbi:helix-turn-helix domain-containing protein [Bacillus infantis]|uniref:helix-turn-helix domain-containing protein n=1 Tax=Bacillus infantis TaxID=324767 RepID=UPI003CFA7D53